MSQILMTIGTVPATPATGDVTVYPKSDKKLYIKDDTGTETAVFAPSTTDDLPEGAVNKYFDQTYVDDRTTSPNVVVVKISDAAPGEYTSIADAIAYVATQTPTATNPYIIKINPGRYVEPLLDISAIPYLSIIGASIQSVIIEPDSSGHHIFKIGSNNDLSFMTLQNAGSGFAGIAIIDNTSGTAYGLAHKVVMWNCDTCVLVIGSSDSALFYGEYLDFEGSFSYGLKIESVGGNTAYCAVIDHYLSPTNAAIGAHASGSGASFIATVYEHYGLNVGTGVHLEDGANMEMSAGTIEGVGTAYYVPNSGAAPSLKAVGGRLRDNTTDINILQPLTTGSYQGVSSHVKVSNASPDFYWNFLDIDDGELEIRSRLSVTFDDGTHTDLSTSIIEGSTSGVFSGGSITDGGGLIATVSSGYGYAESAGILYRVDWAGQNITLTTAATNYLYFSNDGVLHKSSSFPDLVSNIYIGRVVTNAADINFIDSSNMKGDHYSNQIEPFFREGFGPIYSSGSIASISGTALHIDVTSGTFYLSAKKFQPSGGVDISFTEYKHNGSSAWTQTALSAVNNTHYNSGNTYTALTAGYYAKHALYVNGDGADEKYFLVLSQAQYSTLLLAEGGDLPLAPDYFTGSVSLIASVIVQEGVGTIVEILDSRPTLGFKASGTSASSDHQALSNRSDTTAHSQYLLKSATDAMGIDLDMGGFDIVNIGALVGDVTGTASGNEPTIAPGTAGQYWRGDKSWQTLNAATISLGNVDNVSDVNKPVSTAQAAADAAVQAYAIQRANHTGTQLASTISDFSTATDTRIALKIEDSISNAVTDKAPSQNAVYDALYAAPSKVAANDVAVSTSSYTVLIGDKTLYVSTAGVCTITLPDPSIRRAIVIKDTAGTRSTAAITVARFSSETIDGISASRLLQSNYGAWTFESNGGNWFIT